MSLTREQQEEIRQIVTQQVNEALRRRLLKAAAQPIVPQPLTARVGAQAPPQSGAPHDDAGPSQASGGVGVPSPSNVASEVAEALVEAQTALTTHLKQTLLHLQDAVTAAQDLAWRMDRLLREKPRPDGQIR